MNTNGTSDGQVDSAHWPMVASDAFRHAVRKLPTGGTVVTTVAGKPLGCTASSVMSLSVDPPSVVVSLTTRSRTLQGLLDRGRYAVNVLPWSGRGLAARFSTGDPEDRFTGVEWKLVEEVPVIPDPLSDAPMVCQDARSHSR